MMRPRGTPPTPIAASSESDVVDIAGISETSRSPRRMIDPLPNLFSILSSAASMARLRSEIRSSDMVDISFFCSSSGPDSVVSQEISSVMRPRITQLTREWNRVSCRQHGDFRRVGVSALAPQQPSLRYPFTLVGLRPRDLIFKTQPKNEASAYSSPRNSSSPKMLTTVTRQNGRPSQSDQRRPT